MNYLESLGIFLELNICVLDCSRSVQNVQTCFRIGRDLCSKIFAFSVSEILKNSRSFQKVTDHGEDENGWKWIVKDHDEGENEIVWCTYFLNTELLIIPC